MSISIPLTLIDGAMAVPRLRPLDRLPRSYGRDWTLLPPNISLRAEIHALYTAMSRTFCVNATTFLSLCWWEPRRAAASEEASTVTTTIAPDRVGVLVSDAAPGARESVIARPQAARYGSTRWAALAGGACVFGGAAVLVWIGFHHHAAHYGHPAHADLKTSILPSGPNTKPITPPSPPLATPDAPKNPVMDAVPLATIRLNADSGALSEQHAARAIQPQSSKSLSARNTHGSRAKADETSHRRGDKAHQNAIRVLRDLERSAMSRSLNAKVSTEVAPPRSQVAAKPSSAGDFSPFAPAALGADEYASVRLSANTHVRAIEPTRAQPQTSNVEASNGWTNRISQRRITDVPDQFTR